MEPKGNLIKLSTLLAYGEKSSIIDVWLGLTYASVKITLHSTFFKRTWFIESYWKSLRFYLKKNKILRVHVKDKSCNSLQDFRPATLLKRYSNTGVFLWIFKKF